jgi:hypothetical protein
MLSELVEKNSGPLLATLCCAVLFASLLPRIAFSASGGIQPIQLRWPTRPPFPDLAFIPFWTQPFGVIWIVIDIARKAGPLTGRTWRVQGTAASWWAWR